MATVSQQEDIDVLWRRFKKEGTVELRNKLVETYLPIVKFAAERLRLRLPESVDVNDLISAGMFGLMDAIEKFDIERNIKFETYCSLRIRGAIIDELRHCDWIPRSVRTKSNQINNALNYLKNQLGREPTDEELAYHLEISQEELQVLYKEANTSALLSFDQASSSESQDSHMAEFIKSKKANEPSDIIAKRELKELLIKDLLENEKQIIVMYYFDELTMQEIGRVLDVTESRVSQIHAKLLVKLRSRLSKMGYGGE